LPPFTLHPGSSFTLAVTSALFIFGILLSCGAGFRACKPAFQRA
jgi:hypothetical protein